MLSRPSHSWDAQKWKHFQCYEIQFWCSTTPGRGRRVNKLSRSLRRCFWTKPHLFKNDHHTFSTRCGRSLVIVSIYLIIYGIKAYILQKDNKNDKYNFHWPFPTCNGWPPHRALAPLDPQEPDFHLWPLPENDPIMNENLVTVGTHFFFPDNWYSFLFSTQNIFLEPDIHLWPSPGQDLTLN